MIFKNYCHDLMKLQLVIAIASFGLLTGLIGTHQLKLLSLLDLISTIVALLLSNVAFLVTLNKIANWGSQFTPLAIHHYGKTLIKDVRLLMVGYIGLQVHNVVAPFFPISDKQPLSLAILAISSFITVTWLSGGIQSFKIINVVINPKIELAKG